MGSTHSVTREEDDEEERALDEAWAREEQCAREEDDEEELVRDCLEYEEEAWTREKERAREEEELVRDCLEYEDERAREEERVREEIALKGFYDKESYLAAVNAATKKWHRTRSLAKRWGGRWRWKRHSKANSALLALKWS